MPLCPPLSLHVLFYSISYRPICYLHYTITVDRDGPKISPNLISRRAEIQGQEKEKQQLKELWFEEHVKKWLREEATDEAPAEEEEIVEV